MEKILIKAKYSAYKLDINKDDFKLKNINQIIEYFKSKIDENKYVKFISIFDHYSHTKSFGNEGFIEDKILDGKNLILCYGRRIENEFSLVLRPRSIAIVELKDKFIISFLDASSSLFNNLLIEWCENLKNKNIE